MKHFTPYKPLNPSSIHSSNLQPHHTVEKPLANRSDLLIVIWLSNTVTVKYIHDVDTVDFFQHEMEPFTPHKPSNPKQY